MTWGFNSLQENFSTPFSIEYPIPFRPRPVFFTQIAQWLKRFPEKKKIARFDSCCECFSFPPSFPGCSSIGRAFALGAKDIGSSPGILISMLFSITGFSSDPAPLGTFNSVVRVLLLQRSCKSSILLLSFPPRPLPPSFPCLFSSA